MSSDLPTDPDDLLASLPDPGSGLMRTASGRVVQKRNNMPLVIGLGAGALGLMAVALMVALGDKKKAHAPEKTEASATPTPDVITKPPKVTRPPPRPRDDAGEQLRRFTEAAWTLAQQGSFKAAIAKIESAPARLKQSDAWKEVAARDLARYRALVPLEAKFLRGLGLAKQKQPKVLLEVFEELDEEHGDKAFARAWRKKAKQELGEEAYDKLETTLDAPPPVVDGENGGSGTDPGVTVATVSAPELSPRGSAARRERFKAEAAEAAKRLEAARAALARRRAAAAKRLKREEKQVKKESRRAKRGRWEKTRVTEYSAAGFTIKRRRKTTSYRWETCPAELGFEVMKLAIDVRDTERLLELALYAMRRGLWGRAKQTAEQLARRATALASKLPNLDRMQQDAKVFRGRNNHKPDKPAGQSTIVKWTFERARPQELRDLTPFDRRIRVGAGPDEQLVIQLTRARAPVIGAQLRGYWEDQATLSLTSVSVDPPPCLFVATSAGRYSIRLGEELEIRKFLSRRSPIATVPLAAKLKPKAKLKVELTPKDARQKTIAVSIDGKQVYKGELPAWGRIAFAVGAWTDRKPGQILFDDVRVEGQLSRRWAARVVARAAYERARAARLVHRHLRDPERKHAVPTVFAPTSAEDPVALAGLAASVKEALAEGRAAMAKGRTRTAARAFDRAAAVPECAAGAYLSAQFLALAGRPEAALLELERALAGVEDFYEALAAKASILARLGRRAEARTVLDRALKLRPDYAPAYIAEADLKVLEGDHPAALEALDLADALAPGDPMVAFTRDKVAALAAGPGWSAATKVESEHYALWTDTPEPEQLKRQLETIQTRYAELIPEALRAGRASKDKPRVLVFNDPEDYYRYAYATRGRRTSRRRGQFNPWSGELLVYQNAADRRRLGGNRVLFHEGFHQWLHAEGVLIPFWLDEGLAEYASTTSLTADNRRLDQRGLIEDAADDLLRLLCEDWRERTTWPSLMATRPREFYRNDVALKTAQAWSLAHYVYGSKDADLRGVFLKYLQAYQQLPSGEKLKAARLEHAWIESFQAQKTLPKLIQGWEAWVAKLAKQQKLPPLGK